MSGVYEDFCCGSVYRSKEIFEDPLAIQLQLGTDDFEVCCPVKSHATIHKINATYIQIKTCPLNFDPNWTTYIWFPCAVAQTSNLMTTTTIM